MSTEETASRLANTNPSAAELADCDIAGTAWPLIPDGIYLAQYQQHHCIKLASFNGAPRVFARFKIVEPGEHFGKILYRAYPVKAIVCDGKNPGKPIVGGRFIVGRRSDLLREYCNAMEVTRRPDRISFRALKHLLVKVRTRIVMHDSNRRVLPPALRYSVIAEIVCKEVGG